MTQESYMSTSVTIPGAMWPNEKLLCGGQPTEAQFLQAAAAGFATVINLRPPAEMFACGIDEPAVVAGTGMKYVSIPVGSPADLSAANARLLWDEIQAAPGQVMVHCASGNRVGALWALAQRFYGGAAADAALNAGRAAGLAGLETAVRGML
jgi:uncharacterized protein (TIGR01244 family)